MIDYVKNKCYLDLSLKSSILKLKNINHLFINQSVFIKILNDFKVLYKIL